jgi:hypothetical protein
MPVLYKDGIVSGLCLVKAILYQECAVLGLCCSRKGCVVSGLCCIRTMLDEDRVVSGMFLIKVV